MNICENIFDSNSFEQLNACCEKHVKTPFKNEAMEYIENNISQLKHVPCAFTNSDNTISFYD